MVSEFPAVPAWNPFLDNPRKMVPFLSGLSILHCPQNPLTIFSFSFSRMGSYLFFYSMGCTSASSMKNEFSSCGERCRLNLWGLSGSRCNKAP